MLVSECIQKEIKHLKMSPTKVAEKTGFNKTTVWRIMCNQSPVNLDFIIALEKTGLIKPFRAYFKKDYE